METVLHHWGVRSFVEHPTVWAKGPGQMVLWVWLAREDAMGILQYLQPTPEEAVEGVTLYCGPVTRQPHWCHGGRSDGSTCIYWAPEETSSPLPGSIPKHWQGEEERSWQLSPIVCGKSAPKTMSPRPQGQQIEDLPRLQTGIWKSRLATDDLLPRWLQGSEGAFKYHTRLLTYGKRRQEHMHILSSGGNIISTA